jgi:hypothetical protein
MLTLSSTPAAGLPLPNPRRPVLYGVCWGARGKGQAVSSSQLARSIAEFESVCASALAQPCAPTQTIERAHLDVLRAIDGLPTDAAGVLLAEASRYVDRLGRSRGGPRWPSAA